MSKRLYVGGLPYSVANSQLEEIFSKFGKVVSCEVITDRYSGQSKGFGFIEMEKDKEAEEAIKNLNGTKLDEREITVNEARPREERPRFDNRGGGSRRDNRAPRRGGYY
ncbi:RNA-binding protein [Candidatus Shapirobacteria bacterium CG10_big_fil_rev_8_21_14_0_10_38_14]|uniref:RNA-binding protein n=1 Tax=Candidatus Shapirobacteria bacterium CG10_big_fil_rev_8_21_14_0_10_38_14 TaxID=1974483 RepID=A0A2M8L5K7_9BACT|nr:MAG: RNA-binding protein [Candidatus Shapirobacteria bacterium CG10_big_fil_rev_8_21_14_0_10_38_14]